MPFTNAAIFYRTEATKQSITPDPANLPAGQFIHFNTDTLRMESFQEVDKNNIVTVPAPNSTGVRKATIDDNGVLSSVFLVSGQMAITETTNIIKLKAFRKLLQREVDPNTHIHGIFGINWPKVSAFSVDATSVEGFSIEQIQWNWGAPNPMVSFTITLKKHGADI